MLQIVVVGIGAMGCLFAAHLSSGAEVTMFGHWPQQLAALRAGLTLITPDETLRVNVRVTSEPHSIVSAQVALVLVKSYQTAQAAREIEAFLDRGGIAVTLQNGLGNDDMLASRLDPAQVVLGSTSEGASLEEEGVVRHAGRGDTFLQQTAGREPDRIGEFAQLLRRSGFRVQLSPDVNTIVWRKLAVNAAINPLTALVGVPNGFLLTSGSANGIARQAASEAAQVARARGIDVSPFDAQKSAMDVARSTASNRSSMLQDILNNRPTEIDAITGAIVQLGSESGIPTPVNKALYDLLTFKMSGGNWKTQIVDLPGNLQRTFWLLYQEGQDEGL